MKTILVLHYQLLPSIHKIVLPIVRPTKPSTAPTQTNMTLMHTDLPREGTIVYTESLILMYTFSFTITV